MKIITGPSSAKDRTIRFWTTLVIVVIVMALAVVTARTAEIEMPEGFEEDPLTVVRVFNDARNAKMIDPSLSLIDDDVEFVDQSGQAFSGKTPIRKWLQERARQEDQSELCDLWVSGDTVVWTERVLDDGAVHMTKSAAVVERGKIKSLQVFKSNQ
jgi:hypothetical protein